MTIVQFNLQGDRVMSILAKQDGRILLNSQVSSEVEIFPLLYHAHYSDYTDDLPFWLDLARKQRGTILELGCGTGRVLISLAQAGRTVYGLDNDPNMLAVLRQQFDSAPNIHVHIIQADLTAFHLAARFSLIILPCNTFSTLDAAARHSALTCIRRHLAPGGLLAVSIPNPYALAELQPSPQSEVETVFTHPQSGNPVQVSCDWVCTDTQVTLFWHYEHLLPDGQVTRLTVSTSHHLTSTATYRDECNAAGFAITATYGNFDRTPYTPASPHLIVTLKRHPTSY